LALAVPLSRFTPLVGGGSAFFVRRIHTIKIMRDYFIFHTDKELISGLPAILDLEEQTIYYAGYAAGADVTFLTLEPFDVPLLEIRCTESDMVFMGEADKVAVADGLKEVARIAHGKPFRTRIAKRPKVIDSERKILTKFVYSPKPSA
jgi:hypothetical protein